MMDGKFLTVAQVAEWLSVGQYTVREWIKAGRLRGVKLPGGDWRVRPEDLDAMLGAPASVGGMKP